MQYDPNDQDNSNTVQTTLDDFRWFWLTSSRIYVSVVDCYFFIQPLFIYLQSVLAALERNSQEMTALTCHIGFLHVSYLLSVKSKQYHPPWAIPGHLTPTEAQIVGIEFDQTEARAIGYLIIVKKMWSAGKNR